MTEVVPARSNSVDVGTELPRARAQQLADNSRAATRCGSTRCVWRIFGPGAPVAGVARPSVDPDHTEIIGLDRVQARALIAAIENDTGRHRLRSIAVVKLLLHNGSRVDELCAAFLQ